MQSGAKKFAGVFNNEGSPLWFSLLRCASVLGSARAVVGLVISAVQDATGSVAQSSLTPASSSWFLYRMRSEGLLENLERS